MSKNQEEKLHNIRHSCAHILAAALTHLYEDVKFGVGPVIENGFYYDIDMEHRIAPEDLPKIEKEMRKIINAGHVFKRSTLSIDNAKKKFDKMDQPYKVELIEDLAKEGEKEVSLYETGDFTDLCRGGHVESSKEIPSDAFRLTKIAGAYWRGDEKRKQLQRIYGVAFENKNELKEYLHMQEEAEKRDHKKLGKELDLFTFSDLVGPGLPLWTPKGMLLRNILDDFVWTLRSRCGYEKIEIPHITKKDLYVTSGHWEKFKDELFKIVTREGHEFAMKPMNCPHHTQIYARKQWSYRELPQRYANTTMCYRDEQSGELSGLSRVISLTQDDAHVFCRSSQAKEEFLKIWDIVHDFYGAFGFNLQVRISKHDPEHMEKYLGDEKLWQQAESMLMEIAQEKNTDAYEGIGEAAFYGPKLDFMAHDALGREWQVATIQLDMNLPERFSLFCINEKGEKERIVMIHAAIMGSIERFLSILIEHYAGAFPVWLSPVQVAVIPISEKASEYAQKVTEKLKKHNVRAELHAEDDSLGKRIRAAEKQKIPYIAVVGEKEADAHALALRIRDTKEQKTQKLGDFIKELRSELRLPAER